MAALKQRSRSLDNIFGSDSHKAVYAEIANVKRQIKLVEGERRANYETNEEELKNNEIKIGKIRKEILAKKKEVDAARASSGDFFSVVAAVWKDEKGEKDKKENIFRSKTFAECQEILESLIGDAKNKVNLAKYEKGEKKGHLSKLLNEEKHFEKVLYGTNKNVQPMFRELREAENNSAHMEMRITEAENIHAKYKTIFETLKSENYFKGNSIKSMELVIMNQQKEERKLEESLSKALQARQAAITKLNEVEEQTMKESEQREEKLMDARLELQRTRGQMEEIGNKLSYPKFHLAHRDSSLADGLYFVGTVMGMEEVKTEHSVLRVHERLADMTGESDPPAIVTRFEEQRARAVELEKTEIDLKSKIRKEKLRKRFLEDKLTQLQFSGGIKRDILDTQIFELKEKITATEAKKTESEKQIAELNEILDEAIKKLSRLCSRHHIELPPDDIDASTGERVNAVLKILFDKVESILLEEKEMDNVFIFPSSPIPSPESDSILPTFSYGSSADLNLLEIEQNLNMSNVPLTAARLGVPSRRSSLISSRGMDRSRGLSPGPRSPSRGQSSAGYRDYGSVTGIGITTLTRRSESSEDEEAVSRSSIKIRSQQIVEAKTRKGRYKASSSATPMLSRAAPNRAGI